MPDIPGTGRSWGRAFRATGIPGDGHSGCRYADLVLRGAGLVVAADRAVRVERFELAVVLEPVLELQDLNGEAQQLVAMRQRGGLDVGSAASDLLLVGVALRELQVDEGGK